MKKKILKYLVREGKKIKKELKSKKAKKARKPFVTGAVTGAAAHHIATKNENRKK